MSTAQLEVVKGPDGQVVRLILKSRKLPPCELPAVVEYSVESRVGDISRLKVTILLDDIAVRDAYPGELG